MKIAFVDFWSAPQPFNPLNNFFLHALRACSEGVQVVSPSSCDVLFYGPFGDEHRLHRHCLKVFYTGENIRPDFSQCHAALSFDPDCHGGKNMRLPAWHLYIDWFGVESYGNPEWLVPVPWLMDPQECPLRSVKKHGFCSIVYGKQLASRRRAIADLSGCGVVDVFGKANPEAPIGDGELIKLQTLARYRFSLCHENSIAPGYHTEKLLHGKVSGGIPIYYGHESFALDFNPSCCIHVNMMTTEALLERVREIDSSPSLYQSIVNQPIFDKPPDLGELCDALYSFINGQTHTELTGDRSLAAAARRLKQQANQLSKHPKALVRQLYQQLRGLAS